MTKRFFIFFVFISASLIAASATHVLILLPGDTTPAAQLPPKPKTGPLP